MASIFIGIGGTGDWVLTYLKEKVRAVYGEVPAHIQFRLLDTLAPDQRNNTAARLGAKVGIGPQEYLQLADQPPGNFYRLANEIAERPATRPHLSRWFKAKLFSKHLAQADFNLVRGAGQHRQFGRMGMFLNKQQIMNLVRKALDDSGARRMAEGEAALWIVGSVAGGTGAGVFPDMALLARQAATEIGGSHRILGVAVLPSVFGEVINARDPSYPYEIARAYAAMREIARFQAPVNPDDRGRDAASKNSFRFSVEYDEATRVLQYGKLFDSLVLYDHPCGNETERRSYYSQIADGLSLMLDPAVGNKLFANWINAEEGYAASFNSHRVFLPARLFEHLFRAEAMLKAVDGLLPLNADGAPKAGVLEDRRKEAWEILEQQSGSLFNRLARLREDSDFRQLDQDLKEPRFIVDNLLGFNNPEAYYGRDATPAVLTQVRKLHRFLSENIPKFGDPDNPDDYAASKTGVVREFGKRRTWYEGEGENSFSEALKTVRPSVRKRLENQFDEALTTYLRRHPANAEGLGRFVVVRQELVQLLNQCRERIRKLGETHEARLQSRRNEEAGAREDMEKIKKPLFGRGDLPQRQQAYFDAADAAQAQWQRGKLLEFAEELIVAAQECLDRWRETAVEWQKALGSLRQENLTVIGDIHEELNRHTLTIQSSSLGITNRPDMDGYQEELRKRCTVDPQTGASLSQILLGGLEWRREATNGLRLGGWPGRAPMGARELHGALRETLDAPIAENMRRHEGMANYMEWLRDVKQGSDLQELANRLERATQDFADRQPITETRKFLLLHGDKWTPPQNQGQDAFLALFNHLTGKSNIGHERLEANLRDADGRTLFQDRNVIALLVSDNKIDYSTIHVMKTMHDKYLEVRSQDENQLPWRTQAYHLFRCEQEAWEIERRQVRKTQIISLPPLSGEYYRVLDEPERVVSFVQALVVGVVRETETGIAQKEWVCGLPGAAQPIYLTDGGGDLFRALVTFVQDKKDRRLTMAGDLRNLETIKAWIEQTAAGKPWSEWVREFRENHGDWLAPGESIGEAYADPRRAFLALMLDYYLRED
jgi:hypothetical protein